MRQLVKKFSLVALGVIVATVIAELAARYTLGPPIRGVNITPVPYSIRSTSTIPGVRYMLRANAKVTHQFPSNPRGYFDPGATLTYQTNSLGFRGPETSRSKPVGVFRVLGLGDSFTFGTGVRHEDTFLAVLEKHLEGSAGGRTFEVLNLGVMGYNTVTEVALLSHLGIKYDPDVVIICFFLNDAQGGATHSLFNVGLSGEGSFLLERYSVLVDRIAWTLQRRQQASQLVESYKRSFQPEALGWIMARQALDKAAILADRKGFELILMIFPVLWDLSSNYPFKEVHDIVASFATERSIPVLDLLPEFAGFHGPELWVHPTNQHPNERAHEIAGQVLYRFVSDCGIVHPSSGSNMPPSFKPSNDSVQRTTLRIPADAVVD